MVALLRVLVSPLGGRVSPLADDVALRAGLVAPGTGRVAPHGFLVAVVGDTVTLVAEVIAFVADLVTLLGGVVAPAARHVSLPPGLVGRRTAAAAHHREPARCSDPAVPVPYPLPAEQRAVVGLATTGSTWPDKALREPVRPLFDDAVSLRAGLRSDKRFAEK